MHSKLAEIFERATIGGQELAINQEILAKTTRENAVAMRNELEQVRGAQLDSIVAAFSTVQNELVSRHALIGNEPLISSSKYRELFHS